VQLPGGNLPALVCLSISHSAQGADLIGTCRNCCQVQTDDLDKGSESRALVAFLGGCSVVYSTPCLPGDVVFFDYRASSVTR
jgi:hypothetical protein